MFQFFLVPRCYEYAKDYIVNRLKSFSSKKEADEYVYTLARKVYNNRTILTTIDELVKTLEHNRNNFSHFQTFVFNGVCYTLMGMGEVHLTAEIFYEIHYAFTLKYKIVKLKVG